MATKNGRGAHHDWSIRVEVHNQPEHRLRDGCIRLEALKRLVDGEGGKSGTHAAVSIAHAELSQEETVRSRKRASDHVRLPAVALSLSPSVLTDDGALDLEVPRDRQGRFEPQLVEKYARRLPGFDDKVISMYARGMTTREIRAHVAELYGVTVSAELVSKVTDAVLDEVAKWQSRPLVSTAERKQTDRRSKIVPAAGSGFGVWRSVTVPG